MNESNDEQLDPTVDRLLQQAFAGRLADAAGRGSLADVRQRARRHQRRRTGGVLGAAAVVGLGSVALLSREGEPASTAGDDGVATSTTAAGVAICDGQSAVPVATDAVIDTWPAEAATTTTDGFGGAPTEVVPTYTTVEWPSTTMAPTTILGPLPEASNSAPAEFNTSTYLDAPAEPVGPCVPAGQFRCVGNTGADDQGYTYFEYCEPTGYVTTTIVPPAAVVGLSVVIVDASGGQDASAQDMLSRLSSAGFGPIRLITAARTVEQTMLMPTGDTSRLAILQQLTEIDGFDTWTPNLIDEALPQGAVAVVIGQDYWERMGLATTAVPYPYPTTTWPNVQTTTSGTP